MSVSSTRPAWARSSPPAPPPPSAAPSLPLVCTHQRILKLFTITGLDGVFKIYDTVDAALAGLDDRPADAPSSRTDRTVRPVSGTTHATPRTGLSLERCG